MANSSSILASASALMALTLTSNVAALPARFLAWYSSGKVTSMVFSSPTLAPFSCSSKPGMKRLEPITRSASSAEPPSNTSPSSLPTKSMVSWSPSAALTDLPVLSS
ncbi:hypothetical protein D3C71_1346450 [compost metagenome]